MLLVCALYLFVIYWDGSEFSLAKIIRIYESLCAVSDRPEAAPHTGAHSPANRVCSSLSRSSIEAHSVNHSSVTHTLEQFVLFYFFSLYTHSLSMSKVFPASAWAVCLRASLPLMSMLTSFARLWCLQLYYLLLYLSVSSSTVSCYSNQVIVCVFVCGG